MALIGSLDSGISALTNFSKGLEVISDNIANVNTVGFKGSTTDYADNFSDVLQNSAPAADGSTASNTTATQIGLGMHIGSVRGNFAEGTLDTTGVPTDMAITGNGYFSVKDPQNGNAYVTRAGDFRLDDTGNIVTSAGLNLQGLTGGKISYDVTDVSGQLVYTPTKTAPSTIGSLKVGYDVSVGNGLTNDTGGAFTDAQVAAGAPTMNSYSIGKDGNVNIYLSNGDSYSAGQVMLQDFRDPNSLIREGNNLYSGQEAAGAIGGTALTAANNTPGTNGLGGTQSGSLELSNVDLTQEFSDLITTQRSFQAASRIVTVSDSVLEEIVNLKH